MPVNKKYLFSCIALTLLLCFAQITANALLLMVIFGSYLLLLGLACSFNYTLPILLFFLPWSTLMKLSPTSYSIYTIGLVLSCGISVLRNRMRMKQYALFSGILIMLLTLVSKLLDDSGIAFSYIAFLMMLVILPTVKQESLVGGYDFYELTLFYSWGIILAALCAMWFASYSNIARYIQVDSYNAILRRSGFYGDANFYTAQITAALGGCLFLLLQEDCRSRILILVIVFALLYCGAMSASKSFVLVTACLVLIWMYKLMLLRNRPWMKLLLLMVFGIFVMIIARSDLFRDLIEVFKIRFSGATDLNSFTTHRTELWEKYVNVIFSDIKVFLLGKGFTNIKVDGWGSHNTILQLFYQFGILGTAFLFYWNLYFLRDGILVRKENKKFWSNSFLIMLGVYLPWLAIDALFFDDFFLLQWYVFMSFHQNSLQPTRKTNFSLESV